MTTEQEHAQHWNDRLLDWLDGDVDDNSARAFQAHLATCPTCQQQLQTFQRLDAALRNANPTLTLNQGFDQRLFARIDQMSEAQRAAARARVELELRENLQALSRSWRRTLAFLAPGVVAGIALAFALSSWFFTAELTQPLVASAEQLSGGHTTLLHGALTALLGAAVGGVIAQWLASLVE